MCEDFFLNYGSHVGTGTVHFGGTYVWKSVYNGVNNTSYKKEVFAALKKLEKTHMGEGTSNDDNESTNEGGASESSTESNITTSVTQVSLSK